MANAHTLSLSVFLDSPGKTYCQDPSCFRVSWEREILGPTLRKVSFHPDRAANICCEYVSVQLENNDKRLPTGTAVRSVVESSRTRLLP